MSDSDDDMPLAQRGHKPSIQESDGEDDQPLANRKLVQQPGANGTAPASNGVKTTLAAAAAQTAATAKPASMNGYDNSSSDDDIPLGVKMLLFISSSKCLQSLSRPADFSTRWV